MRPPRSLSRRRARGCVPVQWPRLVVELKAISDCRFSLIVSFTMLHQVIFALCASVVRAAGGTIPGLATQTMFGDIPVIEPLFDIEDLLSTPDQVRAMFSDPRHVSLVDQLVDLAKLVDEVEVTTCFVNAAIRASNPHFTSMWQLAASLMPVVHLRSMEILSRIESL